MKREGNLCSDGGHIHDPISECQEYLRSAFQGRFDDITDEQCCACYFGSFSWTEEKVVIDTCPSVP